MVLNIIVISLLLALTALSQLQASLNFLLLPFVLLIELLMVLYSVIVIRNTIKKMQKAFPYERMTLIYFFSLSTQTLVTLVYYSLYYSEKDYS